MSETNQTKPHTGGCYCGAVRFEAQGPVQFSTVCHCSICRRLQASALGAPVTFFPAGSLKITQGADRVTEFYSPKKYSRPFCSVCGTRLSIGFERSDPPLPVVGVYTTLLDDVIEAKRLEGPYVPANHIFYADRAYDVLDGKPKYVDSPASFGGSDQPLDDRGNPA